MIYKDLAYYYDELFKDDLATEKWVKLVLENIKGRDILELASGSGDIAFKLSKNYNILASDISVSMLKVLHHKYPLLNYNVLDMRDFTGAYDGIICFCDSINYLSTLKECRKFFKCAYNSLNSGGKLIFDMHSSDRISEFKNGYIEEGYVKDIPYLWSIEADENTLYHTFVFYHPEGLIKEQHIQQIFNVQDIIDILKEEGFEIELYTDFDKKGIVEGEKYFIVGGKR